MNSQRIALANLAMAGSPEGSVTAAERAIAQAGAARASIVCFPECFVPGYRGLGYAPPAPDAGFLERAWRRLGDAAKQANVTVILGTERIVDNKLHATALVLNADGTCAGCQDKVQVDPSEDATYAPGLGRHAFRAGPIVFGVSICHEAWRYPETVRWPARRGAHIVFHPHFHPAEPGGYVPRTFGDAKNTFHEKAALCRAAENTVYFATVNYACPNAPTTSAVVNPDGTLLCYQPYGQDGLLLAEIDLEKATGLLAKRWKPTDGKD